jgi:hypothetical protein
MALVRPSSGGAKVIDDETPDGNRCVRETSLRSAFNSISSSTSRIWVI